MRSLTRRQVGAGVAGAAAAWCLDARADAADGLQQVRLAFSTKAITPANIDMEIPEYLGYYREEGLSVEPLALGSYGSVLSDVGLGRVEISSLVPDFQLSLVSKGTKLPIVNFFESTYPFKYAVAVKPDSPLKRFADLSGKLIGIPTADQTQNARALLAAAGLNPDKDVSFLATGEGMPGALALQRGNVDALFAYDTIFGTIEGAGVTLRYLPQPANLPQIGGTFLGTTPALLEQHRHWFVGVGRAIAKAHVFIQTNPTAAAYVFTQMYPEALPKGMNLRDQVKAVLIPTAKRAPLYRSSDKSVTKHGYIARRDWEDSANLLGVQVSDITALYSNDLIDEINQFDSEKIKRQAREFALPFSL